MIETYEIDSAAKQMMFFNADKKTNRSLSDLLSDAMHDYEEFKSLSPSSSEQAAAALLVWINRAFTHGVVEEGDGLLRKLEEKDKQISSLKEENSKLREEAEKCTKDLVFIQGKYDELNEKYGKWAKDKDIPR